MSHMHMNGEVVQSLPVFGMQHPFNGGGLREEIQEQLSGLFHASSIGLPRCTRHCTKVLVRSHERRFYGIDQPGRWGALLGEKACGDGG